MEAYQSPYPFSETRERRRMPHYHKDSWSLAWIVPELFYDAHQYRETGKFPAWGNESETPDAVDVLLRRPGFISVRLTLLYSDIVANSKSLAQMRKYVQTEIAIQMVKNAT